MAFRAQLVVLAANVLGVLSLQMYTQPSFVEETEAMKPSLVSAVIPTCNRAAFLSLALEQLGAQDYPLIEAVVVDDSDIPVSLPFPMIESKDSDDGKVEVYEVPRADSMMIVRLVRLHTSTSIGEKRNAAVREAHGDVIIHWDDDDLFPSTRISSQVLPLLRGQSAMTVLEHKYFYESGTQQFLEHNQMHELPNGEVVRYNDFFSKGHGALFLGTLAYQRDLWGAVGGYEAVSKGEDIRFIEAALKVCAPLLNIHNVPNVYVRHNNTQAGVHNTWTFSKLEQHLMYDFVHKVERPAFVSDRLLARQAAAEAQATAQGSCAAPAEAEAKQFSVQYFPEMPASCCAYVERRHSMGLGCEKPAAPAPAEASVDLGNVADVSPDANAAQTVAAHEAAPREFKAATPEVPPQEESKAAAPVPSDVDAPPTVAAVSEEMKAVSPVPSDVVSAPTAAIAAIAPQEVTEAVGKCHVTLTPRVRRLPHRQGGCPSATRRCRRDSGGCPSAT
eukprot:TRINITY_DN2717_c0_g1_i13.p1 TRINITY_DN2717_c0_g1~~TRINITY_DN2717_c0_g1_i13.p1  ORF type:complete len:524 (-),score=114.93 TRINITY_DN2717_c0_g1_i13:328-1833(-)